MTHLKERNEKIAKTEIKCKIVVRKVGTIYDYQ